MSIPRLPCSKICTLAVSLILTSSSLALADLVHLKNGKSIEGVVVHDPDSKTVLITKPSGIVVKIADSLVARKDGKLHIVPTRNPADEFRSRLKKIDSGSLDALVELAIWTREKRLRKQLKEVSRKILRLDPHNELARKELGYVVFANSWVLESELRKKRREKGLVKFRGEWMKEAEKERRLFEDKRKQIADLFASVQTKNRIVQEYAVQELMDLRDPLARGVFAEYLDDENELVRIVAVSALTNFPVRGQKNKADGKGRAAGKDGATGKDGAAGKDGAVKKDPEALRITEVMFRSFLANRSPAESKATLLALRMFQPEESFRLALEELKRSAVPGAKRDLAQELLIRTLRKDWLPSVCRALVEKRGDQYVRSEAVLEVLREVLRVDHGYDVKAWLDWWRQNESNFRDDP